MFCNRLNIKKPNAEEQGGLEFKVTKIVNHPGFSKSRRSDDISLWFLEPVVAISATSRKKTKPRVSVVKYAGKSASLNINQNVTVAGWGTLGERKPPSDILMEAQITPITNTECQGIYGKDMIPDTSLCARAEDYSRDTCAGDSGKNEKALKCFTSS